MAMTFERTDKYQGIVYRTIKRNMLPSKQEREQFDESQVQQKRGRAAEPEDFEQFDQYLDLAKRKRNREGEGPQQLLRRGVRRKLKDIVRSNIKVAVLFRHVPVIPLDRLMMLRDQFVINDDEFVRLAGASARLREEQILLDEKERDKEREKRDKLQLEQSEASYKLANKYDIQNKEKPKAPFAKSGGGGGGGGPKKK
jgi:hypothetical protein